MKPLTLIVTPTRNRRLNELVGLLLLLSAALLSLALVSYHSADPSLDTAGAQSVHNWTGRLGATLSDLLLQIEGAAAFLLPLLLLVLGIAWIRSRATTASPHAPWIRLAGLVLALVTAPVACALLPGSLHLFGVIPLGGVIGTLLLDTLVGWINYPGACVLVLFLAAISIYLLTTFSFGSARQWLLVRSAVFARLRDRWKNWRLGRADRRAAKAEAREQARADALALKLARQAEGEEALELGESETEILATPMPTAAPPLEEEHREERTPIRRGGFSDVQDARPPVATGWDDETFTTEVAAALNAPVERLRPAETPAAPGFASEAMEPRGPAGKLIELPRREPLAPVAEALPVPARPQPGPGGIAFGERADADQRPVTMTARSVHGYESAFKLPPTTLLTRSDEHATVREEELRAEAQVLVEKCAEFDVGGSVVQINPGPVVTTFEFRPEAGVKYSRVTGLSDDLCLAMAAESILIERMAGKSTVGIQVPNSVRETIWLRDIIEADGFANSKSKITMAMGKDINGRIVVADLATMPHVLIAGSTGSGKSVAINAMIMSVLFKATPEQVRLILVDPKRVELGMYEGIPHLFTPIITEPKLAANALKNAVREMERRLKLLASRAVRNIDQYNRLFDEQPTLWDEQGVEEKPLPYIMIIIDELADLMILDKSNVEEAITRLAQMARAVGIHLILATQRPSVDVITGLIKANVPTRMSFRLATKIDSRTILDTNGAESLLGRGDMLFLPPGTSRIQRVHAPFVTEKETAAVVSFWKAQAEVKYAEGFLDAPKDERGREIDGDGESSADENDPLFDDAVRLVFEFGKASTSLLQRRMRIGYGRAAALIDMMERDGLVGPPEGSKPRELLKPASWLNESDEALR